MSNVDADNDKWTAIPKWFLTVNIMLMPIMVGWGAWVTNTVYTIKAQTENLTPNQSYVNSRLDRMSDQLRDLERRWDRGMRAAADRSYKE